jgi:hypothetical protein
MANEFKIKNGLIVSGSADFEQDLRVRGTLTVDEFHTSITTSSIIYESGSTRFGDTIDDSHTFTGSVNITGSISLNGQAIGTGKLDETTFNTYTSSYKVATSDFNGLTNSYNSFTTSYISASSSFNTRIGSLESFSSSLDVSFVNEVEFGLFSSSIKTFTSSLNNYTTSLDSKLNTIDSTTGSLNTYTSSANGRLNSIESATASLYSFSSSVNNRLSTVETSTGSLNSFSSSTNTRLNTIETSTSSLNSYSSSNDTRLGIIETSTSSLNSFTSSINTTIKNKLNADGVISGSSQILNGSNVVSSSTQVTNYGFAITGSNLFKGDQTHSGSIIPAVDNAYDLGSPTYQWRDVYISSGSLYIDGTKVISSTTQELQITTDNGQSIKILESGTDSIILQTADGDIELKSNADGDILLDPTNGKIMLKGAVEILNGQKIQSSVGGTPVVFANDIVVSGSIDITGTIEGIDLTAFSSSVNTRLGNLESAGTNLNSFTASANNRLGNLETESGSIRTIVNSYTSSTNNRLTSIETTTGSILSTNTTQDGRLTSIESKTGSYATTGSNIFQGNQTITGSLYVSQDLIIAGSSSIQHISSSVVNIADNIITVNAQNPSIRFGGLAVIDSGSSPQVSGSMLFDSTNDQWIFVHQNQTTVTSSILLMGPQTYNNLGSEAFPTTNRILKSVNAEHVGDSNISDNGTTVTILSNTIINGTISATGTTLVSGSAQISFNGITDKPALVSGSSQVSFNGITDKPALVSGSAQISFNTITDKPTLVSGSSQVSYPSLSNIPSGIVSGSGQVDLTTTANYSSGIKSRLNAEGVISGSSQVTGIGNPQLVNPSFHIGTTSISLGRASASQTLTGVGIDGNAGTVTNGVYTTGDQTIAGTKTFSNRVVFNSAIANRPQFPGGILGIDTGDGNFDIWGISREYYPSHPTAGDAWGLRWNGNNNDFEFVGGGTNRVILDMDSGNITSTGAISASNFSGTSSGTNTGDQTNISGNAGTVTNGVYTTGNQTIGGTKTFSATTIISLAGFAGIEYYNATSQWQGYIGTENNTGNLRYNSFNGAHTFYANGTQTMAVNASGQLSLSGSNSGSAPLVNLTATGTGTFQRGVRLLNSGMNSGDHIMMAVGQADSARNMGQFYFQYNGAGSTGNRLSMGLHSVDDVFNIFGSSNVQVGSISDQGYKFHVAGTMNSSGALTQGGNQVLHAGNYTSYSPTLTGGSASGTWGISITGNAGTATLASNSSLLNGISVTQIFNNMGDNHSTRTSFDASTPSYNFGFRYVQGSTNGPGTGAGQFYSWYIGLGNEYPATGSGSYGAMFAVDRNVTTPYLSVRYNENNSFGSWRKIHAGYADTAGNITAFTINQNVGTGNLPTFAGVKGSSYFDAQANSGFRIRNAADSANAGGWTRRGLWEGNSNYDPALWAETGFGLYFYTNGSATIKTMITPNGTLLHGHTAVPTEAAWLGTAAFGRDGYNKVMCGSLNSTTTGAYVVGHNSALNDWADLNFGALNLIFRYQQTERARFDTSGHFIPGANGTYNLGSASLRWNTVFTSDLSMSNGIGDYTIVEGEEDLFIYNNKTNKVFKFLLQEVDPSVAPAKKVH